MGVLDYTPERPSLPSAVLDHLKPLCEPMGIRVEYCDSWVTTNEFDSLTFSMRWGTYGMVRSFTRQWIVDHLTMGRIGAGSMDEMTARAGAEMGKIILDEFCDEIVEALELDPKWLKRVGATKPEDAPGDIEDHIIGYRVWRVSHDGRLLPVGAGADVWRGNAEIRAECRYHGNHASPAPSWTHCHCGLNAYFTPEIALSREGTGILGVVAAHGDAEVHCDGFRAEYMRPLALVQLPGRMQPAPMGVPMVDTLDELVEFGKLYGVEVPEELRPEPPQWDFKHDAWKQPQQPRTHSGAYGLWQIAPADGWKRVGEAMNRLGLTASDAGKALQQFSVTVNSHMPEGDWYAFTPDRVRYDARLQFGLGFSPNSIGVIKGITS